MPDADKAPALQKDLSRTADGNAVPFRCALSRTRRWGVLDLTESGTPASLAPALLIAHNHWK